MKYLPLAVVFLSFLGFLTVMIFQLKTKMAGLESDMGVRDNVLVALSQKIEESTKKRK